MSLRFRVQNNFLICGEQYTFYAMNFIVTFTLDTSVLKLEHEYFPSDIILYAII